MRSLSHLRSGKTAVSVLYLAMICALAWRLWSDSQAIRTHEKVLAACTGHLPANIHYHATLKISYNGEPHEVPASIGIEDNCMHPVHTHDTTGLIHLDYPTKYSFTVGDLFETWGIIFSKNQIGSIRTANGYTIEMTVNGKPSNEFEHHIFHNLETIEIMVTKGKGVGHSQ